MEGFQSLMEQAAKDAVDFSRENFDKDLDFTIDSILYVDEIVEKLSESNLEEKDAFTLSYIFGAYLGETYKRHRNGSWLFVEETDSEPPQTFLEDEGKTFAFPSKVYHALNKTADEKLHEYMTLLIE
ncbi:hypothetical protein [Agarivorans litoreus]|uniref:hypothetical protein n=1 Tax=Agarivorans litoreus TaxID=1510455 RepID=UPI001C7CCAE5|nr:hypothetical protein [Agarivorans litoreus]